MIWLAALLLQIPLPGATVSVNPGGIMATSSAGTYSIQVDSPWTGTITTTYPGCTCLPMQILGTGVITDSQVVTFLCQDIQPPQVAITYPSNNGTLGKSATLTVSASDNIAVARVEWSLDGGLIGVALTAPYSLPWTSSKKKGWHTLSAKAFDRAGNASSSSVRVKLQ